eukprot:1216718-Pyramimonas_sp.AAC.1
MPRGRPAPCSPTVPPLSSVTHSGKAVLRRYYGWGAERRPLARELGCPATARPNRARAERSTCWPRWSPTLRAAAVERELGVQMRC